MGLGTVEYLGQMLVENLVDQTALARTADTGDAAEHPQREVHRQVFQVVLVGTHHPQPLFGLTAFLRHSDEPLAAEILAGKGVGVCQNLVDGTLGSDLAAVHTRAGAHIHDVVSGVHGVLVVLHHNEGVAKVAHALEGTQQLGVIPLMQADGGLVQNIEHAHQAGADLGGQTDALGFAAAEAGRCPAQGQVAQAHAVQKAKAGIDLFEDLPGDHGILAGEFKAAEKVPGFGDAQVADLADVQAAHGHCQHLGLEPVALTDFAGAFQHVFLVGGFHAVAGGFLIAALQRADHAFKGGLVAAFAVGSLIVDGNLVLAAVEDHIHHVFRQILHRGIQRETVLVCQRHKVGVGHAALIRYIPRHGLQRPLIQAQGRVGNDAVLGDAHDGAQTAAMGASAKGTVEGEHAGGQFLDGYAAIGAGVVLAEQHLAFAHQVDEYQSAAFLGGGFQTVRQTLAHLIRGAHDQTVHHDLQRMLELLVQRGRLVQIVDLAIYADAHVAPLLGILHQLHVLAFAGAHDGGQHLHALALRQGEDLIHHLVDGLLLDLLAAFGTMGHADAGIEQTKVVVDLRHRAHGGTGVAACGLLVDGDGRGEALDGVDIRLFHLPKELPCVGGKTLHIAPLAFGIDGVEGQRGFAGAAETGEYHQLVAGNLQRDVFQVVFARTANDEFVLQRFTPRSVRSPCCPDRSSGRARCRRASW